MMSGDKQQSKAGSIESKHMKMILVLVMAILLFGGPYTVYILVDIFDMSYLVSIVLGFAMVIAGLFLVWYLIKNKIIV